MLHSLLHYNTFGIDAKCDDFIEYSSVNELLGILPSIKGKRWLQIGGGSNLLFVHDFNGIVLHSQIKDCELIDSDENKVRLRVGSGYVWDDFVDYCVNNHYYGLENLSYIPGEVGASAVQNIGAYGVEVQQFISKVETLEVATGKPRIFDKDECEYAYRSSIFKHQLRGKYIVTHVVYELNKDFNPDLEYGGIQKALQANNISKDALTARQLRDVIIAVRKAKLPEPSEVGSAGSFFMNPIVGEEKFKELLSKYPQMPHYLMPNGVKIPAGWMIDQCGWKGKRLGNAGVYEKQALVLVNLGGAKGCEIVELSNAICNDVKQKFGIDIHPEVNFIE